MQTWENVIKVFPLVEQHVRAGKNAKQFFEEALAVLQQSPVGENRSHLGHGIGLFPHEAPHINPNWNDTFEAGDVIAVEPALYRDDLRQGIRLENNYLVTETGVELLSDFPLEL
jgi:Xaa-Pro aminopeptidase